MLTLYHSLTSPYARKVRSVLLEKRVAFEGVNVAEAARSAAEHNPLGKVPTLLLGDGTVLFDSRVIVETLDAMYPEPRLIPEEPRARAIVRHWEALGDGICDVLIPIVLDSRRPPEQRDAAYTHKLENKVRACFDYVEPLVAGRDDVGETFSLADVALVCAFGYVQLRRPELLDERAAILGYVSRQLRRPSLKETAPPNLPIR